MGVMIPYTVAFLATLNAASALNCFTCSSKDTFTCGWNVPLIYLSYGTKQCASVGVLDALIGAKCYKITAQNKQGNWLVERGCLPPGAFGCNAIASAVGWISSEMSNDPNSLKNLNCYTCNSDNCNSAQRFSGTTLVGLALAAAIFLL
ncbi:uncharacterized protein LOC108911258 [Anoplophora glabripennis]|uniref:uncharacterized protein LOC108911258 n=1 Tax=Anoplophora glabripennis TaxID=217634 RepID=UPI000874031C|nr:uncharacterized protein LOC108911258 [Anoplophora glabripennis]